MIGVVSDSGSAFTVSLDTPVNIDSLTLDSRDATLAVAAGTTLTVGSATAPSPTLTHSDASSRNSPSGKWRGPGIYSFNVWANVPHRTIGAAMRPFGFGREVAITETYDGDANLDGRVNADDYFRIDQGFLAQPSDPLFSRGDFNYDGKVNADDYFLIDQAFLGQGAPLGASSGLLSTAAVPEPGVAVVALSGASILLRRRRE